MVCSLLFINSKPKPAQLVSNMRFIKKKCPVLQIHLGFLNIKLCSVWLICILTGNNDSTAGTSLTILLMIHHGPELAQLNFP